MTGYHNTKIIAIFEGIEEHYNVPFKHTLVCDTMEEVAEYREHLYCCEYRIDNETILENQDVITINKEED